MKSYLVAHNIPEEHIIADRRGLTTWETGIHTATIMKERGWTSALVITQYFHIARSVLTLKKNGVLNVHHVHADFFELRDIYSTLREAIAYVSYSFYQGTKLKIQSRSETSPNAA